MFSKAPIKRYYDDVGCAPGPNQYEPRTLSGASAAALSKSTRFVEPKFVAPAPNQYQDPRLPPTPSKRAPPSSLKRKGSVRRPGAAGVLPQPNFNSSQHSEGSGSYAGAVDLEAEMAELRARNAALLETVAQLRAAPQAQPVGADGVILSGIDADTRAAAADCVQHLVDVVESSVDCECRQLCGRVEALSVERSTLRGQLLSVCDGLHLLEETAGRLERTQQLQEQERADGVVLQQQAQELQRAAQAQTLRIKELELLVQVARESEREAHDDTCRRTDRLTELETELTAGRRQRTALEEGRDDLLTQLTDTVETLNAARLHSEESQREQGQLRRRCDALDAELRRTAEETALAEREAAELRSTLQLQRSRLEEAAASREEAARLVSELAAARADAEQQQSERAESELQLAALEGSLAALQQERDELSSARAGLQQELLQLQQRHGQDQVQLDRLRQQKDGLTDQLSSLGAEAEQAAAAATELAAERDRVATQLQATQGQLETTAVKLSGETERGEQLRSDLWYTGLRRQLSEQETAALVDVLAEKEAAVARLESVRLDKESRLRQLATRCDAMQAEIGAAAAELERARSDVQLERERAEQLEQGRTELEALLRQEAATLSRAVAERQAEVDGLRCELERVESEAARAAHRADEQQAGLREDLKETEKQRAATEAELTAAKKELRDSGEVLAQVKTELRGTVDCLESTKLQLKDADSEKVSLQEKLTECECREASLGSTVATLEDECASQREQMQTLRAAEAAAAARLSELEQMVDAGTAEVAALTVSLGEKTDSLRQLEAAGLQREEELQQLQQNRDTLQIQLETAEADVSRLQLTGDQLRLELTQQRAQLTAAEASLAQREDELVEARRQQGDLRQQNQDLAQVCDEQRAQLTSGRSELETASEQLKQKLTRELELSCEVERLRKRNSEAVESHRAAEAVVASVRQNMEEMKQLYEEIVEEKDSNLAELQNENEAESRRREEQAEQSRADLAKVTGKLAEAESAHDQIVAENTILKNEVKLTNSSIEYLEKELQQKAAAADVASAELQKRVAAAEAEAAADRARAERAVQQAEADREEARVARVLVAEEQRHGATRAAEADEWRARADAAEANRSRAEAEAAEAGQERDSLEAQRRQEQERCRALQERLQEQEAGHDRDLEQLYQNFSEMRLQLRRAGQQEAAAREAAAELPQLREQLQLAEQTAQQRAEQLQQLQTQLQQRADESEWKDKYEKLFALVEPFQTQLELYRAERRCLLEQTEGTRAELERLAAQYSQLLGHQNKKQKIHHIMQLKQENLTLKNELAMAEKKLKRQKVLQRQLEERLHGDQNSTLLNATVSSKAKYKRASYDLSKTVGDPHHAADGLSLLGVTPLKENSSNRVMGSPMAASSSLKSARGTLNFS